MVVGKVWGKQRACFEILTNGWKVEAGGRVAKREASSVPRLDVHKQYYSNMTDGVASTAVLKYLDLPGDYQPSPSSDPLAFLRLHLSVLPPSLLSSFSELTSPRERASIPLIKNRRTLYALSHPPDLGWDRGRWLEPLVWDSFNSSMNVSAQTSGAPPRPGVEAGELEREWAESDFVGYGLIGKTDSPNGRRGQTSKVAGENGTGRGHVGRLGDLLAEYEEEREAERIRLLRRERAAVAAAEREAEEEFDTDSDDEENPSGEPNALADDHDSPQQVRDAFERLLRERFIDGLLSVRRFGSNQTLQLLASHIWSLWLWLAQAEIYEKVDYEEKWDPDDRDDEERWFDDDD